MGKKPLVCERVLYTLPRVLGNLGAFPFSKSWYRDLGRYGEWNRRAHSILRNVRPVVYPLASHRIQMHNLRYLAETGTRGFLTGTGWVMPHTSPEEVETKWDGFRRRTKPGLSIAS